MDRFYEQVDPDRSLSPEERERRASSARRAYFVRLAMSSSRARSSRRLRFKLKDRTDLAA
jgi:hypothetical protein